MATLNDSWDGGHGTTSKNDLLYVPPVYSNTEYGRIMDAISEGPCHGLVSGLQSVFLDDTPIQNSDGSFNFSGFIVQSVKGYKEQGAMFGFDASENEIQLGGGSGRRISISAGGFGPYTFTVATAGLTHLRVRIACPALRYTNITTGAVSGTNVKVRIEVASDISPKRTIVLDNDGYIQGEFSSKITKSFKFALPPMNAGGWQITVTRITPDSVTAPSDGVQNDTYVMAYTEIVEGAFTHPWTAKVGIMLDSRKFPSIPRRSFDYDGRIIKVPSNYTPAYKDPISGAWVAGVYTGNWDGTFKDSPTVCFNPAWQFYDLATHTRYGAGNYLTYSRIDKWALYTIAQYCDNMVSDGMGGTEPRFPSSIYLQKQEDALKVLVNMASAFRGMLYYAAGLLTPVQDKDKSVWAIFTNSNVKDGVFKYSSTARKARHTTAMVSYNDPNAGYVLTPELVEDTTALGKFGLQQLDSVAMGCFSRSGAIRFGQWQLITEQTETETVEFTTALEGVAIAPGRIIQINDQFRSGAARFGGRLLAGATTTSLPLDGSVTLLSGHSYTLRVVLPVTVTSTRPDGSTYYDEGSKVEQVTVTNSPGDVTTLTVAPALSVAPQAYAQWLLSDGAVTPYYYKVIGIKESGLDYSVVALEHNPNKYSLADTIGVLDAPVNLNASAFPTASAISISASVAISGSGVTYSVFASWSDPATATPISYTAYISFSGGAWMPMVVTGASARFDYATLSDAVVRVVANYRSGSSIPVDTVYTVAAQNLPAPTNVTLSIV